jgi:hypothetical protein
MAQYEPTLQTTLLEWLNTSRHCKQSYWNGSIRADTANKAIALAQYEPTLETTLLDWLKTAP